MAARRPARGQRGVVFPSPVIILSVVAVAMAAVAYVFTQHSAPADTEITTSSQQQTMAPSPTSTGSASPSGSASASGRASGRASGSASAKPTPQIDRATTPVTVFNNSRVTGLAGQVSAKASQIGWEVVGTDNWYGTIPTSTVYYPPALKAAGRLLALDLGITRTAPAVDPMRSDRLTVILTGPLS